MSQPPPVVATLGECLGLVRTDGVGTFTYASNAAVAIGGAEANVAVGLTRLGVAARWLGRVGDDSLGRRVIRELRGEGVDVRAVVDTTAPTGLMLKERPTATTTEVTYYRRDSAGSRLSRDDLPLLDIASASLLHITGITPALSPAARDALEAALDAADAASVPISFDVNYRSRLWSDEAQAAGVFQSVAARARTVFAGDDEARLLVSGSSPAELAEALSTLGPEEAIVKLGANGAVVWADGVATSAAAVPVTVVDTVGAGDAFVAGYLAEWLAGRSVEERLATAVRTGAAACEQPGDWEGYADRRRLEQELDGVDPVRR